MLLLDITVVNVALPDIQAALHSSFADLQWVVDAYALTLAAFLLTAGVLGDMYGRRGMFAIGLVLFSLASLACGVAATPQAREAREKSTRPMANIPRRPYMSPSTPAVRRKAARVRA